MTDPYVTQIPTALGGRIECLVEFGTLADAKRWQDLVQPFIREMARTRYQPDANWNWPWILRETALVERFLRRKAVLLKITTSVNGESVPLGQLIISDGYPYLPDRSKQCVLLWYLASAPENFLQKYGIPKLKLMRPLLDTAIQVSFILGYEGRVCLHAMPCPEDKTYHNELFAKYQAIGMHVLPPTVPIGVFVRPNDGRYLYCDEKRALELSQSLDNLR